jgi:hypothetical protein
MAVLPIVISDSGYVPQTPAALNAQLIANVTATNPGYTANLPGSLIEDVSSTDTYALLMCDSALGDLINSVSPLGANPFIISQLGNMLGVQVGADTNTSVSVVFSGPPGFVIVAGFIVSDGSYQYVAQDGGVVESGGSSAPLFAVATLTGTWAVPVGSVNQLVTQPPTTLSPALTVTNPLAGTPSAGAESQVDYQARVLQANLAASQGMGRYLKTLLENVPGVQARLVSVVQQVGGGWTVICGGGDPYAVAYAIYSALFDVSTLVGSSLDVTGITNANPGVVTTNLNHGFISGQVVNITGVVGMSGVNNTPLTITVINEKTFSIGVNTTSSGTWTSGGVVTPNLRNVSTSINDFPDSYQIASVNPPQQVVTITATWNTSSLNYVNPATIAQLTAPAIADYINGIVTGQPINVLEMNEVFQAAIASVLSGPLLTRLVFSVAINGVGTGVSSGTYAIYGDPSSYFYATDADITVVQG